MSNVIEITSKEQLESVIANNSAVIIDFYAAWCEPCKQLSPVLDTISADKTNVKICKVNVEDNSDISSKYDIRSIPTMVYYHNQSKSGLPTKGFLTQNQINSEIETRFSS
jgi:thioredoxin